MPDMPSVGSHSHKKKPFSFYVSVLGLSLVALITAWDATSLAIALPVITNQLHGNTLESFWASISFTLGVAITQPIYVSLSDVLGRKQPLYASMALFTIGAIVFAVANDMTTLIAGRLVQGLGGGGLYVLQDIILADITTLKERPLYLGLISIAMALGTILGPILGALFSDFASWRWIGWINLPIVGIGFLIFVFFLHLRPIPATFARKLRRLDWVGMFLFTTGATAVALPLSWAGSLYFWSSWRTILPFILGVFILVMFGLYERKVPVESLIPFRIFSNVTTVASLITGFVHGAIMYTMLFYLPLFFQAVFLEAPLEAAKSTLPVCILTVAFSFVAPVVVEFTRRYRLLLWSGWIIITLSLGLWYKVDRTTSRAEAYAYQSILGAGVGIVFTVTQFPMQASVAHVDDTGLAVGTLIVIRIFGALIGLAVGSTIFNSVFQKSITALGRLPESVRSLEDPSQAIDFIYTLRTLDLPPGFMDDLLVAYLGPYQAIWIVMASLSGIGLLVSLIVQELTLERDEAGRQGFQENS
ncbi:MFS general substrate transporter [Xylariaceae sp. FL0662B]|nr:MFS general substrate transporter [Xylariaceae sp. FL0662B]